MTRKPRAIGHRPYVNPFRITLFLISLVGLTSCGKVGAPVPPARITERISGLTAVQRGASVALSWPAPALGRQESGRSYIARVDVYRLAERRDEEPVLDEDEFEELSEVVGFLDRAAIEAQVKSMGHLQYVDAIDLGRSAALANTRLRYAVRYVNKRGQTALFSNTVAVEPLAAIAMAPGGLNVTAQAQDALTIAWNAPEANVDGTRPASIVGYNVYRRREGRAAESGPLNPEPIAESSFTDRDFQYEVKYLYTVRALSQGRTGLIESANSQALEVTPIDNFAPSPPDPVSVASAGGVISLFWPANAERDVIGYNVYRAESTDEPDKDWVKLNGQPLSTVAFRDDRVVLGQKYFYKVTAVDRFDNESKPSRVASEVANP